MIPNDILQYHRSMPYSAIVSSFLMQQMGTNTPLTDIMQSETLECTAPNGMSPSNPSPQGSGNY